MAPNHVDVETYSSLEEIRDASTPLIPKAEAKPSSSIRPYVLGAIGLTALVIAVATLSPTTSSSSSASASLAKARKQLTIQLTDQYSKDRGPYYSTYDFMSGIDGGLVAAYQDTTIEIVDDPRCSGTCTYSFYIDDDLIEEDLEQTELVHKFTDLSAFQLRVVSSSGARVEKTYLCRYIRHEIRALSFEDVRAYFDAVHTVYTVLEEVGKEVYGDEYKDAGYFMNYHTWMAGDQECDHLHDGMGFITGHNSISLEFEKILRLIDPSVSIPYWDYTIDIHNVLENGEDMTLFYNSVVFNDDWFGPMGEPKDDYVVTGGQTTAYLSVDPAFYKIDPDEVKVANAYNMLRSPWNLLSTPYLSRSNKTYGFYTGYYGAPRCAEFYHAINKETDYFSFTEYAQENCHGSVHTIIGGAFNADWRQWAVTNGWPIEYAESAGLQGFGVWKRMWRAGDLSCPSDCSEVESEEMAVIKGSPAGEDKYESSSCSCSCTFDVDDLTDEEVYHFIEEYGSNFAYTSTTGGDLCREVLKLFCGQYEGMDKPYLGDAMNSGATADPSFWPTHPNIDRLYQWRIINGVTGMGTWLEGDDSETTFYWGGGSSAHCWGHYPEDVMIWKNIFFNDTGYEDHYYTAAELLHRMDPHNGYLSSFFDYFEWPQCAEEGYPLQLTGNSTADDDGMSWN